MVKMLQFLKAWTPPAELTNPCSIGEWMKFDIKRYVTDYTKKVHCKEKQHIEELNEVLEDLYNRMESGQVDLSMEVEPIRRELRELEESRGRRMLFRSRANWALYGEHFSKYFLNLEKKNFKEKMLSSLTDEEGNVVSDIQGILRIGRDFYENLYRQQEDRLAPMEEFQDQLTKLDLPQLSDEDRALLDRPLSPEELRKALAELNTGKSPGSDGLPPEFYVRFWSFLSPH